MFSDFDWAYTLSLNWWWSGKEASIEIVKSLYYLFAWQWGVGEGAQAEILKCESIYEKRSKKKLLTHSEIYKLFNILYKKTHKSMKKSKFCDAKGYG